MDEADFREGIRRIQVALQVSTDLERKGDEDAKLNFRSEFLSYLWRLFSDTEAGLWRRAVAEIAGFRGKPVDLTAGHFLSAVENARREEDWVKKRWKPDLDYTPIDLREVRRRILLDPSIPESAKRYARIPGKNDPVEKELPPRPIGGEKYRRTSGRKRKS